jgi:Ser/Thr protein kinase RdoA (MazF antagonist)
VPSAFLDGYRRRRPFTAEEQSWLPMLARAYAADTLARLEPVLSEPAADDWPAWAHAIHERVHTRAAQLRTALG